MVAQSGVKTIVLLNEVSHDDIVSAAISRQPFDALADG